jgi:5-methylthioadenosine/S-adenosylhomocysteine deaminase
VNHNPLGNALHAFGTTPLRAVPQLVDAGVPIVLGSDYAPAVATPFELVRAALMLHRDAAAREDALTLEQALAMSWNATAALGTPSPQGRIAAGHVADLVVVDMTGPHHLASGHPVPGLALHGRAEDVAAVVVDGRVLVEDHHLVAGDERAIVAEARATLARLGRR